MSRWEPHLDFWEPHLELMRLLDGLANEITATTDEEVRGVYDEDWCTRAAAREVRELIGAVSGAPEIDADVDPTGARIEVESSTHRGNIAEPGRTCHRQH
jgi:hypothetical protein